MALKKQRNKIMASVCGGITGRVRWNATLVRIICVLVSIISAAFPGFIVYIILMIFMPAIDS